MDHAGASLVDFIGVEKSYGAVRALDGADFSLSPGECVGVALDHPFDQRSVIDPDRR